MTSPDISSGYFQILLHEDSRNYTSFLFDSMVYLYERVPCGCKNLLSSFVRALKYVLES
jgi:hypothetical protein